MATLMNWRTKLRNAALALLALVLVVPEAMAMDPWARLIPHAASDYADQIDFLYYMIYWIVIVVWVAVTIVMVYFMIKYRAKPGEDGQPVKAHYSTGNHTLELIWTLTPAAMLLFIALVQRSTWMDIKTKFPDASAPDTLLIEGQAKRFNWEWRYAGADGKFGTSDDFLSPILMVPVKHKILLQIRSKDVLHSFFLPHMRVKQDTVPGLTIPIWFEPMLTTTEYAEKYDMPLVGKKAFKYEIVCAELCGNLHFNMKGIMDVVTRERYDEWYAEKAAEAKSTKATARKEMLELALARRYVGAHLTPIDKRMLRLENAARKKAKKKLLEDHAAFGRKKKYYFGIVAEKKAAGTKLNATETKVFNAFDKRLKTIAKHEAKHWGWDWPISSEEQKMQKEFQ